MADIFNARGILEIAVGVEENGESLYAVLERNSVQEPLRRLWCYLKEQEKSHCAAFQAMLDEFQEDDTREFSPGEYSAYFKAIAVNYIITLKLMELKKTELFATDLEAIEFGISIEKESILTYSALQEYLPSKQKKIVGRIIDEEKQHWVSLTQIRTALRKKD